MPMIFCPTCESMLEIDSSSVGSMVECGSCKSQFTAKLPKEATRSDSDGDDDGWSPKRSSKRRRDDDDDPLDESYQGNASPGSGFALSAMILGIVGAVASLLVCLSPCCGWVFVIVDILAIVFGAITLKTEHRAKAMSGLWLGIAGIIAKVILTILVLVFMFAIR